MALKNSLLAVLTLAALLPTVALADDRDCDRDPNGYQQQNYYPEHNPAPYQAQGHYELRTVQRWVGGRYDQRWIAPVCQVELRGRGWGRRERVCTAGRYEQIWIAGHYENAQEQVWVNAAPIPRPYGNGNGGIVPPGYSPVPARGTGHTGGYGSNRS